MEIDVTPIDDSDVRLSEDMVFGKTFAGGMYVCDYDDGRWGDARVVPFADFTLSPATSVLHYGQEFFEGMKAFTQKDGGVALFRPVEHAKRFNLSAHRLCMPDVDVADHVDALSAFVKANTAWVPSFDGYSLYIRPTMIATEASLGLDVSSQYKHFIIGSPVGAYFKGDLKPISVCVSHEHRRAAVGGTGGVKAGGNYGASLRIIIDVKDHGYDQVVWLDPAHGEYIEEVGVANIFFVYKDGRIATPALSGSILPGITRDSIIRIAQVLGYHVDEVQIALVDVVADLASGAISEVFATGTAAVITPIGTIGTDGTDYTVADGSTGVVTRELHTYLTDIQYGRRDDEFGWMHIV